MTQLLMLGVFWFVSVTGGDVATQNMKAFPLGTWENHDQLLWHGAKIGDRMELATKVDADGKYRLQVVLTKGPDYGIVQFELDGKKVGGQIDLYSAWVGTTPPVPLKDIELTKGEHKLTVTIVGKNEQSTGMNFGIDRVLLTKKPMFSSPALSPYDASGQLDELADLSYLPRLRPGCKTVMFSSYDRTEGNDDGFSGKYSKLWVEDGNSVLAVMDGPGVVERIMFFACTGKEGPGELGFGKAHIRFYLDGSETPAIDAPIEDFFNGRYARCPAPLAGESQGGFYFYYPIPFRDGCKIVIDGTKINFYQVTFTKLPTANGVRTFSSEMTPEEKKSLERITRVWSRFGDPAALDVKNAEWTDVDLTIEPGKEQKIDLPEGEDARMVRAVLLQGDKKQLDAARDARFEFRWDGAKKPAVDLSAEFFFCQKFTKEKYRSLLTGATDDGWYNFMPMPYRSSATLVVRAADKPISCKLRLATKPVSVAVEKTVTLGYLHTNYHESLPTKPGVHHEYLKREGTGHYLGTYLVTQGKGQYPLPFWLEGDDLFTTDGRLAIHGTGSEESFCCGWYSSPGRLCGPGGGPLGGFPVFQLSKDRNHLSASYRWNVADPVPFEKQIEAKIEHGPVNRTEADYRSAAFYYEVKP